MKKYNWISVFHLLILLVFLSGCTLSANRSAQKDVSIGNLWDVTLDDNAVAIWDSSDPVAQEQHAGYLLARDDQAKDTYKTILGAEGNQKDDVQIAIRGMVIDPENPVTALLGTTSNEATMRVAALVNFFNVPMVIPTAGGDNLLPSNNLWAFRLSAPGSAYANYLFGNLLTKADFGSDPDIATNAPRLNIAILYEGNSFGESAAVATARSAMQLGIGIGVYGNFDPQYPDPARLNQLLAEIESGGIHLVYLISSDPSVAVTLVQSFRQRMDSFFMPVLVGQAGGFASLAFIQSEQADGIYILRQKVEPDQCPVDLQSLYQAQTYAAGILLNQAIEEVIAQQPERKWYQINTTQPDDQTAAFRENLRDQLKLTNQNIPCVGKVAFENNGQLKNPQFELVTVENGTFHIGPLEEFINAIEAKILVQPLGQ